LNFCQRDYFCKNVFFDFIPGFRTVWILEFYMLEINNLPKTDIYLAFKMEPQAVLV